MGFKHKITASSPNEYLNLSSKFTTSPTQTGKFHNMNVVAAAKYAVENPGWL